MNVTRLILTALLPLVISAPTFAEHKHHSRDKHPRAYDHSKLKHSVRKADQHYHKRQHESVSHHQHKPSYQVYSDYTVYRSGNHHKHHRYEHQLSYNYDRRQTYRLIAGAIVLNEVLHHVHH